MKLSEMPVQQKSVWLAEKLGYRYETRTLFVVPDGAIESVAEKWGPCWWEPGDGDRACQEPDMTTPEMTRMLMDKLLRDSDITLARRHYFEKTGDVQCIAGDAIGKGGSIAEAVLDAAMRANGFKEKE